MLRKLCQPRWAQSLRARLLAWLLVPTLTLWLGGLAIALHAAYNFTVERLDRELEIYMGAVLEKVPAQWDPGTLTQALTPSLHDLQRFDARDQLSFSLQQLPDIALAGEPLPPPPDSAVAEMAEGAIALYRVQVNGKEHRVAAYEFRQASPATTVRLLIYKNPQQYRVRATTLMKRILLPLMTLATCLTVMVYFALRRGLRPLERLVEAIEGIPGGNLQTIHVPDAPQEVSAVSDAINHLLRKIEDQMVKEKRFIGDAAHQLRTPLAGLMGQAELALKENDPQRLNQRIHKMLGAAQRSSHLVRQLLALARAEGAGAFSIQCYDLGLLVRTAACEWAPRLFRLDMDLAYEGDPSCWV